MSVAVPLLAIAGVYQLGVSTREHFERHAYWQWSLKYCRQVGKLLLRVGMRRSPLEPPNADVTLDIDPAVLQVPGGVQGDERSMFLFGNKQFGVCFNEHTLEHLLTPDDVGLAVAECLRVADYGIFLFPSPTGILTHLYPGHNLVIDQTPEGINAYSVRKPGLSPRSIPVPNKQTTDYRGTVMGSADLEASW